MHRDSPEHSVFRLSQKQKKVFVYSQEELKNENEMYYIVHLILSMLHEWVFSFLCFPANVERFVR